MRFVALLRGIGPMNPNMRNEKLRSVAEGRMDETAGTPDLMRWAEKTFGTQISTRTWKTVHRIAAKL